MEIQKNLILRNVRDAAIFVTDTLDICWVSAQAVFEDKATPEIAISIYGRIMEKMALLDEDDFIPFSYEDAYN
ncbi:MAG: hypothetical protein QNJ47_28310 [Nostocaceae cyanobacterium]|nr:hypothetical protein [Nostocaceae cyanobacterium]